jgi:photosystem II stability/assembly factor-like uncharacterized protein
MDLSDGWRSAGGFAAGMPVNVCTIGPTSPPVMYAVVRDELFKSADAGRRWDSRGRTVQGLAALAVNPKRRGEIYTVSNDGAFFKSTDGGITWEQLKDRTIKDEMRG